MDFAGLIVPHLLIGGAYGRAFGLLGSELQSKRQLFLEFATENAEILENFPWKMMICIEKWRIVL